MSLLPDDFLPPLLRPRKDTTMPASGTKRAPIAAATPDTSMVTITRELVDAGTPDAFICTDYTVGDISLSLDTRDDTVVLNVPSRDEARREDVRNLYIALSHPDMQCWMGVQPAAAITVVPHICDDKYDERLGQHIWTDYGAGTDSEGFPTEVYIPVTPDLTNPEDVPSLFAFGRDSIPLDEVERVLPQIIALLHSPVVQQARAQWEAQQAAAQSAQASTSGTDYAAGYDAGYQAGQRAGALAVAQWMKEQFQVTAAEEQTT